uniref:RAS p21 protein activator 3 n=1 Tax=Esox lucius TaxID=8010 RepID=A0A6Q2YPM9_ESOLU
MFLHISLVSLSGSLHCECALLLLVLRNKCFLRLVEIPLTSGPGCADYFCASYITKMYSNHICINFALFDHFFFFCKPVIFSLSPFFLPAFIYYSSRCFAFCLAFYSLSYFTSPTSCSPVLLHLYRSAFFLCLPLSVLCRLSLSVPLSVSLSLCLYLCPSVCISVPLSVSLSLCLYLCRSLYRSDAKKTKVKRKTNNPQFEETFYFEVSGGCHHISNSPLLPDWGTTVVDLWNASNLKFGDEFLGGVKVPLRALGQDGVHDAWYYLQPRDNVGGKPVKVDELGSLRLNIVYTEDHVFPSEHYSPLRDLLLHSTNVEPVSASAAHILGEACREKQEAAIPLVRLFLHYGNIVPFLSAIAHAEVNRTQDPNTIFRGNSLTSKCIDETMKLAGNHYLQVTLKPIIDEICTDHKPCEIDPVKLKESENLETNRENLRQYVDQIFKGITTSGVSCPTVMCDIFFSLRESAATRFQVDHDVKYTAVSSFIFLRFFAPAILSPNLFQLRPHHPDPATSRTLTLISKTIQTLGSLAKSKSANFKETYMAAFYDYFNEQKYADAVKNVSCVCLKTSLNPTPIMLKEGFMIKRAQGRNRFGMKNFKKRWFRLTNHEFTYHRTKGNAKGFIPIENILAVERLEEESFKMKNMFQVIQPERALYIQANNCVEARDWIDILTKVSQCNRKRLSTYHPSAYLNGHWLCCKTSADTAPGCTPCTGGLPANIQLDVDGDRETERIYSLFSTYMNKLVNMQEACGSRSVYDGPEEEEYSSFVIDDPQETYKTLKLIVSSVQTLEQQHTKYKRDKFKKTKIGSQ